MLIVQPHCFFQLYNHVFVIYKSVYNMYNHLYFIKGVRGTWIVNNVFTYYKS